MTVDTSGNGTSDAACALTGHSPATNVALGGTTEVCVVVKNGYTTPEVLAGKTVTFSPSGLHLMFMRLKGTFVKGKTVPVTLTFAKAGSVTIELAIGGIAASAPPDAAAMPADSSMTGMKM